MRPSDDDGGVGNLQDDRVLDGAPVPNEPELTAFVAALRATGTSSVPAPRADLAALIGSGVPAGEHAREGARVLAFGPPPRRAVRYVAGLGLTAKLTLGAGVAAASVTGVATVDAVPDVLQRPASALVDGVVELVTSGPRSGEEPRPGETEQVVPAETPGTDDPATDGPATDDPDVLLPPRPPTSDPRDTDRPGRADVEGEKPTGVERELPDQAEERARAAREQAEQEVRERAEQEARDQRADDARRRAEDARDRADDAGSGADGRQDGAGTPARPSAPVPAEPSSPGGQRATKEAGR